MHFTLKFAGHFCAAILLVLLSFVDLRPAHSAESFRVSSLQIESGGKRHAFRVELAETARQRAQGLQWRKNMAANHGMLFDFKQTNTVTMWMKNTYLSLDMFFISDNGTIINIARNTVPLSLTHINSAGPARGVLEVIAGTAQRLGIRAGDRILHPIFTP